MTTENSENKKKTGTKKFILIAAIILIAVIIIVSSASGSGKTTSFADMPTSIVSRDQMTINLVESGEIMASDKTIISNNMRWTAIISDRVDEGQYVNVGDMIIRFECKDLLDAIDKGELDLTSAENDYQQAKENIELTRKELANKLAQANAAIENKKNELDKFIKHERLQEIQTAQSELTLNKQDLELAEGELNFMLSVNATEGFEETYSQSVVDAQQLDVDRLRLRVSTSEAELEKLKLYEHPQKLRQLELELEEAELELEKAKLEAQAKQRQVDVDEQAKKRRVEMYKEQITELKEQRDMLEIRAKSPGVIIYDSGNRWETPDLSVGASVNPRRNLMRIPNMATLKAFSKVFEGASEQVKVGTPAIVTLDSRPGLILTGAVDKVAAVASSENRWLNPNQKMFPIEVKLDNLPSDIKPGSSCQVELILDEAENVLQINIAAVMTEQELIYAWRVKGDHLEKCPITIGRTNTTHAEVLSGLEEGDIVLLSPPLESMLEGVKDLTVGYVPPKSETKVVTPATRQQENQKRRGESDENPGRLEDAQKPEGKPDHPRGERPEGSKRPEGGEGRKRGPRPEGGSAKNSSQGGGQRQ